mgnify:CR=1 FL=1
MSKSSTTTTDNEWLHNPHAGELLVQEFMEPIGLTTEALASAIGLEPSCLDSVIKGKTAISADIDLRLGRYFGLSDGFFLRLQDQYELLEAKRRLDGDLDRIVPRAA